MADDSLPHPAPPRRNSRRLRFLIVDSDIEVTRTLAGIVGLWGHAALATFDGQGLLAAIEDWRPDVLVLGLSLPDLAASEVGRRVKALQPRPLIVAVTEKAQVPAVVNDGEHFDLYLVKPEDPKRLAEELLIFREDVG